MGVKGKKRSLEAPDAPKKSAVKQEFQSSPKKQKNESVKTNGSGLPKSKLVKKNKNVQAKQDKPIENVNKSSGANEIALKPKKNIEKSLSVLAKEKEKKRKRRRQNRNKFGQYKPENIFSSVEELEKKISQIKQMEKKSKTARRRLSAFKKKLQIKQGTYAPPAKPLVQKSDKAEKKILKKQNVVEKKNSNESNGENAVAKIQGAVEAPKNKIKQNNKTGNVKKVEVKSKVKVMPKKVEEPEQDDDEDEEDQDDMDASDVEDEDSGDAEEEGKDDEDEDEEEDEDDDDDDDNDDDDDEEKTEKEDKQSHQKKQKVVQQIPKSTNNVAKDDQLAKKTQPEKSNPKKTRYVLFVGNLPYSVTVEDVKKHFLTKVSEVASVRIPLDPKTKTPRGFAYVEFTNTVDYEKGLSLHHSNINGRRVNVQYSGTGSKNITKRPEVVAKNKKLHALRKQGKLAGSVKESQKRAARRNMRKQKNP